MRILLVLHIFLAISLMPLICRGEDPATSLVDAELKDSSGFDAESAAVLNGLSTHVAGLKHFVFDATVQVQSAYAGKAIEENMQYHFAFQRPNLLNMTMELSDEKLTVVADGQNTLFCLDSLKMCKVQQQPENLSALIGWLTQQPAFRRLLSPRLSEGWMDHVTHSQYEETTLDGIPCHHLELTFERTDLNLWFKKGEVPVPLRLVADQSTAFHAPKGTFVTRIDWENWNETQAPAAEIFEIVPPQNFQKVNSFDICFQGNEGQAQSLVGEQTPPFVLDLLDGNQTSLIDHLGKNAIVLEFWATWCRPCKNSLDCMAREANDYAKSEIAFYAVNIMEPHTEVLSFVKKMDLNIPVALDVSGKLAEQYRLEAVPSCVFIGKDGSIQAIHVGYDRRLARQMEDELGDLAKGKNLATDIKAPSVSRQLYYRLELDSESYCAVFVGY